MNNQIESLLLSEQVCDDAKILETESHNLGPDRVSLNRVARGPRKLTERTLVVDDDPLIRRSVERILTARGLRSSDRKQCGRGGTVCQQDAI